ncbi:MAG: acylphosphatase [Burkholderiales bacterium]|nr:acylphosphatase [Burkholderiales bacterium]
MAKHLSITGIVQGVGYRVSFQAQAEALKLSGWVRNRRDGSVEAVVTGEPAAIDKIIAWAQHGPPSARVDHVAVSEAEDTHPSAGIFEMRPTV